MSESPERRNAKRISIRLPVVFRGPDGVAKHGSTANLSRRGMLIVAQEPAAKGTRLRVALTGMDGHEREVVGEVVRSSPEGHVAISVSDGDAAGLDAIVDQQGESQQG